MPLGRVVDAEAAIEKMNDLRVGELPAGKCSRVVCESKKTKAGRPQPIQMRRVQRVKSVPRPSLSPML
jgi:hypothetical protein